MPHRGLDKRAYLVANAFELSLALLAVFSAFSYFVWPRVGQDTAIQRALADWAAFWMVQYGLGGLLIVLGLCRPSPRVELMGLSLFTSAVTINAIAIIAVAGKLAIVPTLTFAAIAVACIVRAKLILRAERK